MFGGGEQQKISERLLLSVSFVSFSKRHLSALQLLFLPFFLSQTKATMAMCETVQVEVEHQNKTRRERKRLGALAANVAKNILPTSSAQDVFLPHPYNMVLTVRRRPKSLNMSQ